MIRQRSRSVGHRPACRKVAMKKATSFKPPVLSLKNAILFCDAYTHACETEITQSPTKEEGEELESKLSVILGKDVKRKDISHFCLCNDLNCEKQCFQKRTEILTTSLQWFRYFENLEKTKQPFTLLDFHHKSLVDHALGILLVEKGSERRRDLSEKDDSEPVLSLSDRIKNSF
mmetsp:Transcript_6517/g.11339  ORF Transcript_6517/g.11339 Transcript_6517/m.11339 type:complete len:174 (+) Transcript_6517:679-1200(+)